MESTRKIVKESVPDEKTDFKNGIYAKNREGQCFFFFSTPAVNGEQRRSTANRRRSLGLTWREARMARVCVRRVEREARVRVRRVGREARGRVSA